jgi:hypothetical protein
VAELEAAGLACWVDDCDDASSECTVYDQDVSDAQLGAEVSLIIERDEYGDEYAECYESYPDDCLDPTA